MKTAIYGGTFAPPHKGHESVVRAYLERYDPDRFLVIPASVPPHKAVREDDDPALRLEMAEVAFGDIPGVTVSDLELRRTGKSYTADTLCAFPDDEIDLIVGTDMFLTLDEWHDPETIFKKAQIVYVRRETDQKTGDAMRAKAEEYRRRYGAVTVELPLSPIEIASTDLRRMIARGDDVSAYLTDPVIAFIKAHGLYQTEA